MELKDEFSVALENISKYRWKNSPFPKLGLQELDINEELLHPCLFENKKQDYSLILAGDEKGYTGLFRQPVCIIFMKVVEGGTYGNQTPIAICRDDEEKYRDALKRIQDYSELVEKMSKIEDQGEASDIFEKYLYS